MKLTIHTFCADLCSDARDKYNITALAQGAFHRRIPGPYVQAHTEKEKKVRETYIRVLVFWPMILIFFT